MAKFSFKGWKIKAFIKGRKHMIITLVSAVLGFVVTNNPALTALCAAFGECVYSIIDYWAQE